MEKQNFPPNEYRTNDFLNQKEIDFKNPRTTTVNINEILVPHLNLSLVGFFNSNDKNYENERTNNRSVDEEISIIKEKEEIDSSPNQFSVRYINLSLQSIPIQRKEKNKIFLCLKTNRPLDKEKEEKIEKSNRTKRRFDDLRTNFIRQSFNCYLYEEVLYYINKNKKNIKFKKFPEKFIAKVALVKNKNYLNENIISLYDKYVEKENQENSEIETLKQIKDEPGVKELFEMTLKQLANKYLNSDKFKTYCEKIKNEKDKGEEKGEEKVNNFVFWGNYFAGNIFCSNFIN